MTGINKAIRETTYPELKKIKLQNTENYIPLFEDVLKIINGKVPLIIELKYDVKCGELEKKTMELLKQYKGKYAIKSFNPISVYWLKKNFPEAIRGQLSCNFKKAKINKVKAFILKNMLLNCFTNPDFISYGIDGFPNNRVEKFRRKKIVLGWTIRNKEDLNIAKRYCDNFICENLDDENFI